VPDCLKQFEPTTKTFFISPLLVLSPTTKHAKIQIHFPVVGVDTNNKTRKNTDFYVNI